MFKRETKVTDSWDSAGASYVTNYRQNLEHLAEKLKDIIWQQVLTEFDPCGKCAVLRTADREILARIQVHGEAGCAYRALVRTDLAARYQNLFNDVLHGLRVEFNPLSPYLQR